MERLCGGAATSDTELTAPTASTTFVMEVKRGLSEEETATAEAATAEAERKDEEDDDEEEEGDEEEQEEEEEEKWLEKEGDDSPLSSDVSSASRGCLWILFSVLGAEGGAVTSDAYKRKRSVERK